MSERADVLTVEEVAARWRVSANTVRQLARSGEIPGAYAVGRARQIRIPLAGVREYERRNPAVRGEGEA